MGIERSKELLVEQLPDAVRHGIGFCGAVFHTSPLGKTVDIPGGMDAGLPDISIVPDLATIAAVPWERGVATCIGDTADAAQSPRTLLAKVSRNLDHDVLIGPELEYFLCVPSAREGVPPGWEGLMPYSPEQGNVYVSGSKGDPDEHLTATIRNLRDFGLGVLGGNHEYFPGQFEINLAHSAAIDSADRAFRFKAAVKDIARREGRLATFMAKPFNQFGGSGFHLHICLVDEGGGNLGDDPEAPYGMAAVLRHAMAGVLEHAPALTALANPTVNSYKRFGRDSLAPRLVDWGLDNRSAMIRVPRARGAGTRIELRLPDASANPYLVYAGVLAAMRLGIKEAKEPPTPLRGYGYDASRARVLPTTLPAALDALEADSGLRAELDERLVASFVSFKRAEVARFQSWVTDWELAEYAYHI
ncbi:MAG: glutamine synthetase [Kutzneria sp.]|nr:glutamine synthetase [Kutzneria sp.]